MPKPKGVELLSILLDYVINNVEKQVDTYFISQNMNLRALRCWGKLIFKFVIIYLQDIHPLHTKLF